MPRGGKRVGTPGKAYSNRSDLRALPVASAPGQPYGARAAQEAAQRAVPMAKPAPTPPPTAAPAPLQRPAVLPGQLTSLTAPSERPDEPVTAGLPLGAGPGLEALGPLGQAGSPDDVAVALRAAYAAYPSEDLRMILERIDLS